MIGDASARFCPFCGKPVAVPDTAFCAYCGRSLLTVQQAPSVAPTLASYGYSGMGMAAPAAPSIGRMIGVMLGVVGILLVLLGARLYASIVVLPFLYRGGHTHVYEVLVAAGYVIDYLVLVVPFCYWLALLRLRVVSLARVIPEVSAASVVVIFTSAAFVDLFSFGAYGRTLWIATTFGSTRLLLSGEGFALGVVVPLLVGTLLGAGAAFLFTRWSTVTRLPAQVPNRDILHFMLVCGSFVGFALLNVFLQHSIYIALMPVRTRLLMLSLDNTVIQAVFGIGVVIAMSIWMRQSLRAAPAYHAAIAGTAAQPMPSSPYASPGEANFIPTAPVPLPPVLPSEAPIAMPPQDPAQQTPPTEA